MEEKMTGMEEAVEEFLEENGVMALSAEAGRPLGEEGAKAILKLIKSSFSRKINGTAFDGTKDIILQSYHNFEFPSNYGEERYRGFCSLYNVSTVQGNPSQAMVLVSGVGNYATGDRLAGVYLVFCSTMGDITMRVIELAPPGNKTSVEFGYWASDNKIIFGIHHNIWNYPIKVLKIESSYGYIWEPNIANLYDSVTKPSGWETVNNVKTFQEKHENDDMGADFKDKFRTQTKGDDAEESYIATMRSGITGIKELPQYGAALAFGIVDTNGFLSTHYNYPIAYIGGGNKDKLNWIKQLAFIDSNVESATKATQDALGRDIANTYARKPNVLFEGKLVASAGRDFTIDPLYFHYIPGCDHSIQGANSCGNYVTTYLIRITGISSISGDVDNLTPFAMEISVAYRSEGADSVIVNRYYIQSMGEKSSSYIEAYMKAETSLNIRGDSKTYIQKIEIL